MGTIAVRADKYFNNRQRLDSIFGTTISPVDLNAGLVVEKTDKYATCEECARKTQENIQERFGLETPDEDDDE